MPWSSHQILQVTLCVIRFVRQILLFLTQIVKFRGDVLDFAIEFLLLLLERRLNEHFADGLVRLGVGIQGVQFLFRQLREPPFSLLGLHLSLDGRKLPRRLYKRILKFGKDFLNGLI